MYDLNIEVPAVPLTEENLKQPELSKDFQTLKQFMKKRCTPEYNRAYYLAHAEHIKARQRERYKNKVTLSKMFGGLSTFDPADVRKINSAHVEFEKLMVKHFKKCTTVSGFTSNGYKVKIQFRKKIDLHSRIKIGCTCADFYHSGTEAASAIDALAPGFARYDYTPITNRPLRNAEETPMMCKHLISLSKKVIDKEPKV